MKRAIILYIAVGIQLLTTIAQAAAYHEKVFRIERGEYANQIDENTQERLKLIWAKAISNGKSPLLLILQQRATAFSNSNREVLELQSVFNTFRQLMMRPSIYSIACK